MFFCLFFSCSTLFLCWHDYCTRGLFNLLYLQVTTDIAVLRVLIKHLNPLNRLYFLCVMNGWLNLSRNQFLYIKVIFWEQCSKVPAVLEYCLPSTFDNEFERQSLVTSSQYLLSNHNMLAKCRWARQDFNDFSVFKAVSGKRKWEHF